MAKFKKTGRLRKRVSRNTRHKLIATAKPDGELKITKSKSNAQRLKIVKNTEAEASSKIPKHESVEE